MQMWPYEWGFSIHVMKMAGISPFKPLEMYKWVFNTHCVANSSVTLVYKLQNATEKVVFRTNASSQKS